MNTPPPPPGAAVNPLLIKTPAAGAPNVAPSGFNPLLADTSSATALLSNTTTPSFTPTTTTPTRSRWFGLPLPYPTAFENINKEATEIFASAYQIDGAKFTFNKGLSYSFNVGHSINLTTKEESNYHFNTTFVGDKKLETGEQTPILLADIDNKGNLIGQIIHQWGTQFKSKLVVQSSGTDKNFAYVIENDYKGKDFHSTLKVINPDLLTGTGTVLFNYLQSITPRLSLGGEYTVQADGKIVASVLAFGARYTGGPSLAEAAEKANKVAETAEPIVGADGSMTPAPPVFSPAPWIASACLYLTGRADFCYFHRVNEKVSVATELAFDLPSQSTVFLAGYEYNLRQSTFRGDINSKGVVSATLDQKIAPGFTFHLTGQVDHMKGTNKFGLGLTLGG